MLATVNFLLGRRFYVTIYKQRRVTLSVAPVELCLLISNRTTKSSGHSVCSAAYRHFRVCLTARRWVLYYICLAPRTIICHVIQSWPCAHIMRDTRRRRRRCVLAISIRAQPLATAMATVMGCSLPPFQAITLLWQRGGRIMKIKWRIKKRGRVRSIQAGLMRESPSATLDGCERSKGLARQKDNRCALREDEAPKRSCHCLHTLCRYLIKNEEEKIICSKKTIDEWFMLSFTWKCIIKI